MNDEGGYWETGDVPELERRPDFLNEKIAELAGGLSKMNPRGKTPEELADEIEGYFEGRRTGDGEPRP